MVTLKIMSMMYLCQFDKKSAIGSEVRVQTRLFIQLYEPGDLEKLDLCKFG